MRKNLCVGILSETRYDERRTPLSPSYVKWLVERGVKVEVESSPRRAFMDND